MQAVDEELHDVWFEKVPELDVASVAWALEVGLLPALVLEISIASEFFEPDVGKAKLVAFSVLCLYHMRCSG